MCCDDKSSKNSLSTELLAVLKKGPGPVVLLYHPFHRPEPLSLLHPALVHQTVVSPVSTQNDMVQDLDIHHLSSFCKLLRYVNVSF